MAKKVRASIGTLGVLGLELVQMETPPTTAYLQIYTTKRCKANCLFCAQASGSSAELTHIARGIYMPADLELVVKRLKIAFERGYLARACIQTALYDNWWQDTVYLIKRIRSESQIPVSLSVFPLSAEQYGKLKKIGVDELVIPLDACTPELFDRIKGKSAGGPYSWKRHVDGLKRASRIFEKVGTHLMLGIGESDEDAVRKISELQRDNVNIALFSYTYIPGSQGNFRDKTENSVIKHYRTVQLARYLILEGFAVFSDIRFENGFLVDFGVKCDVILEAIEKGEAFQTSGCPDCNRPMANETFSKIYNFPRKPNDEEIMSIKRDLGLADQIPQS
ncbi:MAG: radical SAM protein [Euryarchaeota archaeon]|nr:radical SAM protein [Euryarchaeota archaeon]MBU4492668.1 radical SAM protein [Euryarchaeota archaeon]